MIRRLQAWAMLTAMALALSPFAAAAKCTIQYQELPLTMADLQPEIEASVNGQKVRFVLDSGAFYSVMTPGTAAALKLRLEPAPYGLMMTPAGGAVKPSVVTAEEFQVADTTLHRVQFLTGGSETGDGTAGVLGQNFLFKDDVEYDLANGIVRLVHPQDCKGDMVYWDAKTAYQAIDLIIFNGDVFATTTYVQVNGQKLKAQFDTGAGVSFLTLSAARRLGFDPNAPGVVRAGLSHGFGRTPFRTWIMPVESFKIGDEEVKHTKLRVGDTTFGDIDMLIGPDFFLSHHVYVANRRKRIYFTYNGGPVFDLSVRTDAAPPSQAVSASPPPIQRAPLFAAEPTDAEGYARRGAALLERQDYAGAIADLTKAHDLAPAEAAYLYRRGRAYEQNGQPFLAMADLDAALKLAPDDVDARMLRASMRIGGGDPAGAREDIDAIDRALAPQADQRLELAVLYQRVRADAAAVRQYDLWIKAHPDDARLAQAENGRCWMGAMSGADLDAALAACNAALALQPKAAAFLDSRGLVRLRRGETDKALADYNAALAINPKIAWSLYGRALAEQRKGMADAAKADLAAAAALNPKIAEEAKARGIGS